MAISSPAVNWSARLGGLCLLPRAWGPFGGQSKTLITEPLVLEKPFFSSFLPSPNWPEPQWRQDPHLTGRTLRPQDREWHGTSLERWCGACVQLGSPRLHDCNRGELSRGVIPWFQAPQVGHGQAKTFPFQLGPVPLHMASGPHPLLCLPPGCYPWGPEPCHSAYGAGWTRGPGRTGGVFKC